MSQHPSARGKVLLAAWVDRSLRSAARMQAEIDGVDFSTWVEERIRRACDDTTIERAKTQEEAREKKIRCRPAPKK